MTKGQNVKDMMTAMNPPRTFDDSFYLYGDAAKKKISLDDTEKAKSEPLFRKKSSGINNNVNVNIDFSRFGQYALFYITPHFNSNYSRLTQKSMKAANNPRIFSPISFLFSCLQRQNTDCKCQPSSPYTLLESYYTNRQEW